MRLLAPAVLAIGLILTQPAIGSDGPPQRIVSAGGDLTEIIYALGASDRLVGVDSTSTYPESVSEKAQIGYVRRVSSEGVLSLKPDLVLGADDMGPPAVVDQLRAAGVAVELAPKDDGRDGVASKIRFVGRHLKLEAAAEKLARQVDADMKAEIEKAAQTTSRPRVLFVLAVSEGGLMSGGDDSSAAHIIELAGGVNAATGFTGYKTLSLESVMQAQPDIVLMMEGGAARAGGIEEVLKRPELALTPAGIKQQFVTMDGMLLLGFGPRTPAAIAQLSTALHQYGN